MRHWHYGTMAEVLFFFLFPFSMFPSYGILPRLDDTRACILYAMPIAYVGEAAVRSKE